MIGFIGFGTMGKALSKTLLENGFTKDKIICFDPKIEQIQKSGFIVATNSKEVVEKSNFIFLCVKPNILNQVLEEIKSIITNQTIISIAAGMPISKMKTVLGEKKIVRVMPNICALVSESASAFTSINLNSIEKEKIKQLLENFGKAIEIEEKHFNAVTGLSGSGPAFVAYFLKLMISAGEENGLTKEQSKKLALQTLLGTSKLLSETKISPEELIEMVSSPNGTTIAGRKILENSAFEQIIKNTIARTKQRAEELGKNE